MGTLRWPYVSRTKATSEKRALTSVLRIVEKSKRNTGKKGEDRIQSAPAATILPDDCAWTRCRACCKALCIEKFADCKKHHINISRQKPKVKTVAEKAIDFLAKETDLEETNRNSQDNLMTKTELPVES